jgi:hypothetical protein
MMVAVLTMLFLGATLWMLCVSFDAYIRATKDGRGK